MEIEDQGQGQETGTVQQQENEPQVQSGEGQGSSGQGFLDSYLADVPEEQRAVVAPILEKYRQDQDANFNRRFEQVQEEARIPTTIYQSLMQDPVNTLNWIADRMQEERGLDVREQLKQQWYESQNPEGQGQQVQSQENSDQPLTQADIDRILEEREQARVMQERQQQFETQQQEQQAKTINGWVDNAAKTFGLKLDDSNGEDPLRSIVIMQANQLHESGVAKGQAAVEMAVEAVSKRFGSAPSGQGNPSTEPKVANGGTPPPAKEIDFADKKQRKDRMMEMFQSTQA